MPLVALLALVAVESTPTPLNLPGEREFASCLRLKPEQRFRLSLKPETDVQGLIAWISAATCRQFIVPGGVALAGRKVTVISPQDLEVREAYPLFIALLDSVQLTVEPVGKFLRVVEAAKAGRSGAPFYADGQARGGDGYASQLLRLKNADAGELARVLEAFKGESGTITPYPALSALIVTDREANLERIATIAGELDTPGEQAKLWVLPVRHLQAKELAERLGEILGKSVASAQTRGAAGAAPSPAAAVKLFPDERAGRLLVVASDAAYARVAAVAQRLDVAVESGASRVHVYRCKHADCDTVAALLGSLSGVDVTRGPAPPSTRNTRTAAPAPASPAAPPRATGEAAPMFDGPLRLTSDPSTNAILVVASLDDFRTLQRLAEEIDVPRKQVFVEATIMEILTSKSREIGGGYHLGTASETTLLAGGWQPGRTLLLDPANLGSTLVGLSGIALGAPLKGVAEALGLPAGKIPSVGAFIHLLQTDQNVNLIANPHILITNNQEGEISVGQKIPFQTGITSVPTGGGAAVPFLPISREDVALTLNITPHVSDENLIRLEINQEMSEVAPGGDSNFGPITTQRKARTVVYARDRQPIIIGGLTRDKLVDTSQKAPLLGDIPLIGILFRNTLKTVEKQNIIIALTPHVIEGPGDLAQVLEQKLRERQEFVRSFGTDEERRQLECFRRTPGMVERINRAVKEVEAEEVAAQPADRTVPEPLPL